MKNIQSQNINVEININTSQATTSEKHGLYGLEDDQ